MLARRLTGWGVSWAFVFLTGCVTAQFTQPIAAFQQSVEAANGSITSCYNDLNSFERTVYFEELAQSGAALSDKDPQTGRPTPLLGRTFPPESIKARTDSISLLGLYGKKLAELSGSAAPSSFKDKSEALGAGVEGLETTFKKLSTGNKDATAKDYAGPISTVEGVLGEMYLEGKRDAALRKAVHDGAPAVRKVLALLEVDITQVIQPLRVTGLLEMLSMQVRAYNAGRMNMTPDQRRSALAALDNIAEQYETAVAGNPADVIAAMRQAHEALVKFADSPRSPADFAQLMTALEDFQNKAETIGGAVQKLRALRKKG